MKNVFILGLIGTALFLALFMSSWEVTKDQCPSTLKDGMRQISFLEETLTLPEEIISSCYARIRPDSIGYQPAKVIIDAELPNLGPLQTPISRESPYTAENHIRIGISGYKATDQSDSKDAQVPRFTYQQIIEDTDLSRKNREGENIYTRSDSLYLGFVHYYSDKSIPIYSDDIYIALGKNEMIEFYLRCFENKEKHHKIFNCSSSEIFVRPNVSYSFSINSQHLAEAKSINAKVAEIIKLEER